MFEISVFYFRPGELKKLTFLEEAFTIESQFSGE